MHCTASRGIGRVGFGIMSDGTHDGGWVSDMKNIVLIGISGSGKTYLGNRLAEKLSK